MKGRLMQFGDDIVTLCLYIPVIVGLIWESGGPWHVGPVQSHNLHVPRDGSVHQ
jgi:hypothetical protein